MIVLFFIGLAVGSFLNVVVLRHENDEKITGRSHCMSCGRQLTWKELFPLFSYLLQNGKCKWCGTKISLQYPLVEFTTSIVFVLVYYQVLHGEVVTFFNIEILVLHLIIWSLFIVITVYDFHTKLIPDEFSYTLAFTAFITLFISDAGFINPGIWRLLAGPILFLPFYILWKVSDGRWLGLGDGKLALGIGWFLGLSLGGTAILFSFWMGAGISLLIISWQKIANKNKKDKLTLKSEIPFGPFMVLGTSLVYIFHINMFSQMLF